MVLLIVSYISGHFDMNVNFLPFFLYFILFQSIWFYRDISFKAVLGFDLPGV